jgi:hypothetical protein
MPFSDFSGISKLTTRTIKSFVMSMIKVEVTFQVKSGTVSTEKKELEVDMSTFALASGNSSRRKLDGWAKNFFPAAECVKVIDMKRIFN